MKRIMIGALVLVTFSGAAGCKSSNSTTQTTTPSTPSTPTTPATRVITMSGDLAFGNVVIGTTAKRTFTIGNTGNATLTFSSITGFSGTGTAGLAATPISGTIDPGGSVVVSLFFTPTLAQTYTTVVTVQADQTSGASSLNFSGTGVLGTGSIR